MRESIENKVSTLASVSQEDLSYLKMLRELSVSSTRPDVSWKAHVDRFICHVEVYLPSSFGSSARRLQIWDEEFSGSYSFCPTLLCTGLWGMRGREGGLGRGLLIGGGGWDEQ